MDHGLETMFLNLSPQNKNPKGPIQWQIRTHWGRKTITTMILLAKAPPEREFPGGFQLWLLSTLGSSMNVSTSNPCSWAELGDKWALPKHCPKSQKEKVGRAYLTDFSERSPTQVSMEKYLHKVSLWLPKTKKRRKRNMFSIYWGHHSKIYQSLLWYKIKWGTKQWYVHPILFLYPRS